MEHSHADVAWPSKDPDAGVAACKPSTGVSTLVQIALAQLEHTEQRLRGKKSGSIDSLSTSEGVLSTRRSSSFSELSAEPEWDADSKSPISSCAQHIGPIPLMAIRGPNDQTSSRRKHIGPIPLMAIRGLNDQTSSRRKRLRASGHALLEAVHQGLAPDINPEDTALSAVSGETTTLEAMPVVNDIAAPSSPSWAPYCNFQSPSFLGAVPCIIPNSIPSAVQPSQWTWHGCHLHPWTQGGDACIPMSSHLSGEVMCSGMLETPSFPPGVWQRQQEENNESKVCHSDAAQRPYTNTPYTNSLAMPGAAVKVDPMKINLHSCTSLTSVDSLQSSG